MVEIKAESKYGVKKSCLILVFHLNDRNSLFFIVNNLRMFIIRLPDLFFSL